jgi:hypothetical protein
MASRKRARDVDASEEQKGDAAASSPISRAAAQSNPAIAVSSDSEDGSDSDSSDVSELVVVRIPAALVQQLREQESSILIEGLDSAKPHFEVMQRPPATIINTNPQPVRQKYVGSYEYSVGTQLLWKIQQEASPATPSDRSTPMAALSPALGSRSLPAASTPIPALSPPSTLLPRISQAKLPVPPRIELVGKTWKRLVFSRQR